MSTDLSEGQFFGGYQLLEVAGTGGMGVVYRAKQQSLGRIVALKMIRPEIAQSGDYRSRFLREARLAAAVDHPHVVSVFEVGEHADRLYLAMQWVDGQELRRILDRQQRLDPERAVRIGTQLSMALAALHKAGLLHRDVKPANVLVRDIGGQDHAYLTDFGIAKMPEAEADLTRTGWLIGTPGYLSPEQLQGHKPDPRSDLYALGCIVFEALTGRRPFGDANGRAFPWANASSPPPAASALCPALGARYDAFFTRALALDPQDRFQSGSEFAGALHSAHTERFPGATPTELADLPGAQPLTGSGTGPPPIAGPSGEPEPTMKRPGPPAPSSPMPRTTDPKAHVPPRAAPSRARPGPRPSTPRASAPRKGWASKLIILACGAVFLAAVTLASYYRDPGGKSLLQATSGDPNSPLYPQDFWIPVTLVALVFMLTVIGLLAPRRSPMVCATAAALGLVGYTLYLPTKGTLPGFGPFGSGYWLSLGAAAVMTLAGVAASIRSSRT
jgi:serine/threonine-protein kinase